MEGWEGREGMGGERREVVMGGEQGRRMGGERREGRSEEREGWEERGWREGWEGREGRE